jgi:hypothetical protein
LYFLFFGFFVLVNNLFKIGSNKEIKGRCELERVHYTPSQSRIVERRTKSIRKKSAHPHQKE